MTASLLILGAGGQLGTDLMAAAALAAVPAVGLTHADLDITNESAVFAALERLRPSAVVNSCSFTNVEQCEQNPALAHAVNAEGAGIVARGAARVGARVIYVSTDYVFDGAKPPAENGLATPENSYFESDPIGPLNVYGASKAAGEGATAAATPDHLIVRVSSLFGLAGSRGKGGNFVETIIRRAREGERLRIVDDQWMTPTSTADAADAIIALSRTSATGIVHVTNAGACSWHQFATEIVRQVGGTVPVEAIATSAYPSKVTRPRNSALGSSRFERLTGRHMGPWPKALAGYVAARHKS